MFAHSSMGKMNHTVFCPYFANAGIFFGLGALSSIRAFAAEGEGL
jgi:hypothetical protein